MLEPAIPGLDPRYIQQLESGEPEIRYSCDQPPGYGSKLFAFLEGIPSCGKLVGRESTGRRGLTDWRRCQPAIKRE